MTASVAAFEASRLSAVPPIPKTLEDTGMAIDQIEQLLINLVRNAVDATIDTAGRVSLEWDVADGRVRVRIGARYPLEEARLAQDELEARSTTVKVLLVP